MEMEAVMTKEYLISKGWTEKGGLFLNPHASPGFGGHTLDYAIKIQKEYDIMDKLGGFCYFSRPNKYGYGYEVVKIIGKDKNKFEATSYTHLTRDDATKIVDKLNAGLGVCSPNIYRKEFYNIIIFGEKHNQRYFYAPTLECLHKIALKIFKERVKEGFWYDFDSGKPLEPEISKEQIARMKDSGLKTAAEQAWKDYEYNLNYFNNKQKAKKLYNLALKDETGKIALQFLNTRKDTGYEGFTIEVCEDY